MTTTVFTVRLFGGRDIGVSYDGSNLSILGQSIAISSLSAAQQAEWQAASPPPSGGSRGAFGGDNISRAVGDILDGQPTWRNAVYLALANFLVEQTLGGNR